MICLISCIYEQNAMSTVLWVDTHQKRGTFYILFTFQLVCWDETHQRRLIALSDWVNPSLLHVAPKVSRPTSLCWDSSERNKPADKICKLAPINYWYGDRILWYQYIHIQFLACPWWHQLCVCLHNGVRLDTGFNAVSIFRSSRGGRGTKLFIDSSTTNWETLWMS